MKYKSGTFLVYEQRFLYLVLSQPPGDLCYNMLFCAGCKVFQWNGYNMEQQNLSKINVLK